MSTNSLLSHQFHRVWCQFQRHQTNFSFLRYILGSYLTGDEREREMAKDLEITLGQTWTRVPWSMVWRLRPLSHGTPIRMILKCVLPSRCHFQLCSKLSECVGPTQQSSAVVPLLVGTKTISRIWILDIPWKYYCIPPLKKTPLITALVLLVFSDRHNWFLCHSTTVAYHTQVCSREEFKTSGVFSKQWWIALLYCICS